MPIEFACECGKKFKVADEYAGKRSKCTACGRPVVVPASASVASADAVDEDAAFRALTEEAEPAPQAGGWNTKTAAPPPPYTPPTRPAEPFKSSVPKPSAPPPSYRSTSEPPANRKPGPNWRKVGIGIAMAVIGVLVLIAAVSAYLAGAGVPRWAFIVPGPLVLASPFFIIDGFRDRKPK
jgi:hypothetical protein